jgi:uncharacterized protein YbjT (DUF2867 family)
MRYVARYRSTGVNVERSLTILVVGATGVLGREVVRRLLASGHRIRALTRRPWGADGLQHPQLETVRGDLIDRASLVSASNGIDAILASAHALTGTAMHSSRAVDDLGHRTLIDVAKFSGVKRFVYISARGATLEHPVDFFRTKARIENHLKASGLNFSILRPSAFMESHVHQHLGKHLLERGTTKIYGDGRNAINFVSARDVAAFAVMALSNQTAGNEVMEIGGPCNVSKREIAETYLRLSGRLGKVQCVPTALMRLIYPLVRPFNPVLGRLLAMSIWSDTTDQTFDAGELGENYQMQFTRLEDFVREQIGSAPLATTDAST